MLVGNHFFDKRFNSSRNHLLGLLPLVTRACVVGYLADLSIIGAGTAAVATAFCLCACQYSRQWRRPRCNSRNIRTWVLVDHTF
ncbi:hypothetical protein GE21DRAFT_1003247 [Neurospora crassa]|nr:hypothetical protein GE21DRAFT_1003247 [Neurospora crassa]